MLRVLCSALLFSFLQLPAGLAQKPPAKGQAEGAARQIAIVNLRVSQYEDGPQLAPGYAFVPGESVFLSFQISGYQKNEQDKILVLYRLRVRDPQGVAVIPPAEGKVTAELAPEDKDWLPKVREQVIVPPTADSGNFKVLAWVKDSASGVEAQREFEIPVRGHHVEPARSIEIQNFHFMRSENDVDALPEVPSYRPGDTVWARFDMTGFHHGEKNRYAVKYGLAVNDADNHELYAVAEAASDSDESFYAKRYVPGTLSFTLPKDLPPAVYTVVLRAEDTAGAAKTESRRRFRVE